MKEIQILSKEKIYTVLVDDEDYPVVSRFHWNILFSGIRPYVFARLYNETNKGKTLLLHHLIMGNCDKVDHADGNSLNNQKSNLRQATWQQNGWNKGKARGCRHGKCRSEFKGVSPYNTKKYGNCWQVIIKLTAKGVVPAKHLYLRPFNTEIEAAKAYNDKIKELRGEWAWLNPIPEILTA